MEWNGALAEYWAQTYIPLEFCIYHSNEEELVSQDRPHDCALQKQSRHLVAFCSVDPPPRFCGLIFLIIIVAVSL